MAPSEEQTMILRARAGDGAAFARLYRAHVGRVYAVVASRTRNRDEVEDLVQVAFIRAYEGLNRFRGDAAFSTWVTRIAMNVCVSHYEARCVRQKWAGWLQSPEGLAQVGPGQAEDPEDGLYARECRDLVHRGIDRLPARYKEAMRLRYVADYSYAEIEEAMRVSMGTVKTWLYRGRALLQEAVEGFEDADLKMGN